MHWNFIFFLQFCKLRNCNNAINKSVHLHTKKYIQRKQAAYSLLNLNISIPRLRMEQIWRLDWSNWESLRFSLVSHNLLQLPFSTEIIRREINISTSEKGVQNCMDADSLLKCFFSPTVISHLPWWNYKLELVWRKQHLFGLHRIVVCRKRSRKSVQPQLSYFSNGVLIVLMPIPLINSLFTLLGSSLSPHPSGWYGQWGIWGADESASGFGSFSIFLFIIYTKRAPSVIVLVMTFKMWRCKI